MNMMKIQAPLALILISVLSLQVVGCTSMSSVMPKQGPTMEQVYDGMKQSQDGAFLRKRESMSVGSEINMQNIRSEVPKASLTQTALPENVLARNTWQSFQKIPNPTLHLYVYPHLAGSDELLVPGYTTEFNAYVRDHYALP